MKHGFDDVKRRDEKVAVSWQLRSNETMGIGGHA